MVLALLASLAHAGDNLCNIPVYLHTDEMNSVQVSAVAIATQQAITKWNNVMPDVNLHLAKQVTGSGPVKGAINLRMSGYLGGVTSATVGITYNLHDKQDRITRSRILLDKNTSWCQITGGEFCINLDNIVLHEFGHALGLSHSDSIEDVMFYGERAGKPNSDLQQADIDSLNTALYTYENPCQVDGDVFSWSYSKD